MADDELEGINLKILLLGNCSVGKTSLLLRYTDDNFSDTHVATIGVEYKIKTININGRIVKLQIWDTSGQERFHSLTKNFLRNADGVLFVFDLTQIKTFTDIREWLRNAQEVDNNFAKILVGNKCDLTASRKVNKEDMVKLGNKMGTQFFETSAKTNMNVSLIFQKLAELILKGKTEEEIIEKYGEKTQELSEKTMPQKINNKKKKKGCC